MNKSLLELIRERQHELIRCEMCLYDIWAAGVQFSEDLCMHHFLVCVKQIKEWQGTHPEH